MHGFKKDRFLRRVAVMCLGILVMGVGIGLFKVSLMGNDPSTALGIAVGDWMGIDFSVVVNWFLVGPIASFFEKLFLGAWGQPQGFPQKLLLLGAGVLILSFSCALYQTADVGISPYDSLSLLLARKLPIQYFWCRIFTDAVCVGAAFLLGGLIGLGTLVCALALGPFVAFFTRRAAVYLVYGKKAAVPRGAGTA